jgi:protein-S-isoprenylcysteine O-methyltransferase Ste14
VSLWRHAAAVLLLPGIVVLAVPALIVWRTGAELFWWPAVAALGVTLIALGLVLVARTVALFAAEARGTLAPWDPTAQLVVRGPYRYVRNPMISGVLLILLGEAALFGSLALLLWFLAVFVVNAIYFPLVEEPGLKRRFGEEYQTYRAHVPRWFPRLRPWAGEETDR